MKRMTFKPTKKKDWVPPPEPEEIEYDEPDPDTREAHGWVSISPMGDKQQPDSAPPESIGVTVTVLEQELEEFDEPIEPKSFDMFGEQIDAHYSFPLDAPLHSKFKMTITKEPKCLHDYWRR